jgi:hypothetical protein
METVHTVWSSLPALFVIILFVMMAREDRAGRRDESPIDPMFRLSRPAAGRRPSGTRRRGIDSERMSNVLLSSRAEKDPSQRTLKQSQRP